MKTQIVIAGLLASALLSSCASKSYMTPISTVSPDSVYQITDDDIREAFKTKPQLTKPLIVAVYNASVEKNALPDSLEKLTDVKSVFEVSPWMLEGDNYKLRLENPWYGRYRDPNPAPMKAIRLEAAKGRADVVVYCGISHAVQQEGNWLAWSYVALVPMIFVPGQKCAIQSSIDVFVVDVRNGFMYGSYHEDVSDAKGYVRINYESTDEFREFKNKQVRKLIPGATKAIARILNNPEFYLPKQP